MEAVLAVIVGVVFGSALGAVVAFPLRRLRNRSQSPRPERTRRVPLQSADQRHRAGFVAASFALAATVAQLAGWTVAATAFMLGAVFITVQAITALVVERSRRS